MSDAKKLLTYKGKPFLRKDTLMYYGNAEDDYIVCMEVLDSNKKNDIELSTKISVKLQTNAAPGKERVVKQAEREDLYAALDLGEFWLADALSS
ncbi:MAG: hypothetical protein LBM38_05215 [Clostridiales bacterium]|nr:hypothetical protein [Clostridiales bacterium]